MPTKLTESDRLLYWLLKFYIAMDTADVKIGLAEAKVVLGVRELLTNRDMNPAVNTDEVKRFLEAVEKFERAERF